MHPLFRQVSLRIVQHPRLASHLTKIVMNLFPAIRRTGGRIEYVAPDLREVRVRLPLDWRTRNLMGSTFGGSMFAIADPIFMTLLYFNLGDEYVVWDKSARIRFRKPAKTTLYGTFTITQADLDDIRAALQRTHAIDRVYPVSLVDQDGVVHAELERVVYIGHKAKLGRRARPGPATPPLSEPPSAGGPPGPCDVSVLQP
jgi:acyl-coenzyme A thioesterase PaaI-like protein